MPTGPLTNRGSTAAIDTHGCKLNQADSAALSRQFAEAGFQLVPPSGRADVYVVNTCTVTHVADRKARQAIRAMRRRNPGATIVATGCYAERVPADLDAMAEVDLVMGNHAKFSLVRQVLEWTGIPVPCATGEAAEVPSPSMMRSRAMVKIQEGCDQVCAYCIVPVVRGRERSIPPDVVVAEVNRYVASGYREVVLTGTQLGSYGFDIPGANLCVLMRRILAETGLDRLRVSSLQPQDIGDDLLELWLNPRVCPHFHLPLQSGSDGILKRMRRRYTASLYAQTVDRIRRTVSGAAVTADVIVGFPGETESDYQDTYDFCERIGFSNMHVFPYSPRPKTSAVHFEGAVQMEVKADRVRSLTSLAQRQSAEFKMGLLGRSRPVLWETGCEEGDALIWSGLTDNYVRVVCRSGERLANRITNAGMTVLSGDTLYSRVLRQLVPPGRDSKAAPSTRSLSGP